MYLYKCINKYTNKIICIVFFFVSDLLFYPNYNEVFYL